MKARPERKGAGMNGSIHLIHIGDSEARKRALQVFLDVPETYTRFPGNILGITGKHLAALQNATPPIKFETAKKAHLNGQSSPVALLQAPA
jgi:hypothetical protein